MSEHKTLLQFLLDLLHDKTALADFREDPQGALHAAGLQNVCADDIRDLLPVVLEKVDPQKAAQYEDDCDHGRDHDHAPKHHDPHHDGGHHWSHDPGHDSEIDKVVAHLNYVTNNYAFDSHDTIYNTNNVTKIWADHGAKVDVTNDTHNVGAGGVSIEGDNNAPVATGGHNVIGHDNQLSGDGSTTSFGSGSALSHVGTGEGGAINTGTGTAVGESEHLNAQAYGGGNVTAATHAPATSTTLDSHDHTTTTTDTNSHNSDSSHHDTDNSTNTDLSNHDSGNSFSSTDDHTHVQAHESPVDLHPAGL
jgi:hypothetical protein